MDSARKVAVKKTLKCYNNSKLVIGYRNEAIIMQNVMKWKPISFEIVPRDEALAALEIRYQRISYRGDFGVETLEVLQKAYLEKWKHAWDDTMGKIWEWSYYIEPFLPAPSQKVYEIYVNCITRTDHEPMRWPYNKSYRAVSYKLTNGKMAFLWVFKGFIYFALDGHYTDEQYRLLILEHFDKERSYFEKLKAKFDNDTNKNVTNERPRIPESVRVEVWRRDSGKCARCGSRERLEYDHIVPISRGGSNTARNIELLCEKCNRSKSNNVV